MQNEGLGFAQPKGMSTANTVRIGISGINQPPPDAGRRRMERSIKRQMSEIPLKISHYQTIKICVTGELK